MVFEFISNSPDDTQELGKKFAAVLSKGDIVCLYGELGSGKTQFVKGICRSLGVEQPVDSPTFILVNEYTSPVLGQIYHFDFYRLRSADEIIDIGFDDYIVDGGIILIEWPELAESILPAGCKKVYLSHTFRSENERKIIWQ